MEQRSLWKVMGYFAAIYALLIGFFVLTHSLSQTYAKPLVRFIFPLNPDTSPLKTYVVMTLMYWAMVAFFVFLNRNKPAS